MIVIKLSFLFMLDAFAGSFVLQSIMSGWFNVKYVILNYSIPLVKQIFIFTPLYLILLYFFFIFFLLQDKLFNFAEGYAMVE